MLADAIGSMWWCILALEQQNRKKNQTKRNETTKSCKGLWRDYDYDDYPVCWPKSDAKTKTKSPADGKFASFQLCSSGNCDTMRCDAHGLDQFQCLLASVRWPRELQRIWIAIENYGAWMEWPAAKEKCWSCRFPVPSSQLPYSSVESLDYRPAIPATPDPCLPPHRCDAHARSTYIHTYIYALWSVCTYLTLESWVYLLFLPSWDTLRFKFMQINARTSLFSH